MMVDQRIQKSSQNTPSQGNSSPFTPRPSVQAQQDSHSPPTQEESENDAFNQHKFEAFGLQTKQESGTITPVEQKQLGVLQAKTDNFWAQRSATASRFSHNFANIPAHAPDRQGAAPVQPQPAIQPYRVGAPLQSVQPAIASAQTEKMGWTQTIPITPHHYSRLPLQAKLTIGQPNDRYEQEADRIASQVVTQINSPQSSQQSETIQRQEVNEEEDDKLRMKPLLQLQTQSAGDGVAATPELESEIGRSRSSGKPLAKNIRTPMEQAFGADFSGVKVHTDAHADRLNRSLSAIAFTNYQDVFFGQGAYNPGTHVGQKLLAHELTHVIQQGGSSPRAQAKLMFGSVGDHHEQEADRVEKQISSGLTDQHWVARPAIQRYIKAESNEYLNQPGVATAPMFESNATEPVTDPMAATVRYPKQNDNQPPLYLSEDLSLAINCTNHEPKEFYAVDQVITQANAALATQSSPVILDNTIGHQISLYGNQLKMVRPTLNGQAINLQANEFADLMEHKCINVALEIMGKVGWRQFPATAVLKDQTNLPTAETRIEMTPTGNEVPEAVRLANLLSERPNQVISHTDAKRAMTEDRNVGAVGKEYGRQQGRNQLDQAEQSLGINKYAKANVGQGYMTETMASTPTQSRKDYSVMTPGKFWGEHPSKRESVWGYHFAAVVATSLDGQDQITLENYNRTPELNEQLVKLEKELEQRYRQIYGKAALALLKNQLVTENSSASDRIGMIKATLDKGSKATQAQSKVAVENVLEKNSGKMWYFRIVGSKSGQSFHELMASSSYFANPLTLVVEAPIEARRIDAFFATDSDTLAGTELNMLKTPAPKMVADLTRRPTRTMTITGYATEAEASKNSVLSLTRAKNAKQFLVANNVPAGKITEVDGGVISTLKGGRNGLDPNQRIIVEIKD